MPQTRSDTDFIRVRLLIGQHNLSGRFPPLVDIHETISNGSFWEHAEPARVTELGRVPVRQLATPLLSSGT